MEGTGANEANELNGAKQTERGQELMRAVGMAGKMASRQTQPAEQGTAGRHSRRTLRPAQASQQTNGPQLAGGAAKTTAADQRRPASRRAVQVGGGSAKVLALMKAGADLPTAPTPPIAFACHCPYPLP